ncbi:MAG: CRTAC1 family protein [Planctomycetota bacterium]
MTRPLLPTLLLLLPLPLLWGCSSGGGGGSDLVPIPPDPTPQFVDITAKAGLNYEYRFIKQPRMPSIMGGGVAAGDYDGDGWIDLYVVRGDLLPNLLFRNRGDGTFEEVAKAAGVAVVGKTGSGPTFADINGDGLLDLFIGGTNNTTPRLFLNQGKGTFKDITASSGIVVVGDTYSAAFGDYDKDGDLDLCMAHWGDFPLLRGKTTQHLWRNNGNNTFTDVSVASGLAATIIVDSKGQDFTFTPNFADIDNDGWVDLLMAADFGTSRVFLNNKNGTFQDITNSVITDENGMGSAIADYDNDGDQDWFVSSIWDPNGVPEGTWGVTGNRLYRNTGLGVFEDETIPAGVQKGYWGWAASFADLDNDGNLDIIHVNGFRIPGVPGAAQTKEFEHDPTRLFMSTGNGKFVESSKKMGIDDTGQGRGLVCFDFDRDGDLDLFIANNQQPGRLLRNDQKSGRYLGVKLRGKAPNTEAIGAKIYVTTGSVTQMRELRAGSNFVSQDPAEAHFGMGSQVVVEELHIIWPDGSETLMLEVPTNQRLVIQQD